jgi:mannose-6-phosphate isomerase-like protein (cupin superfamily)
LLASGSCGQSDAGGLEHQTPAGARDGLQRVEVWRQRIAANAATPVHSHDCEEVIVILEGSGTCTIDGKACEFAADTTLLIPPGSVHQIVAGADGLYILAALSMSPVKISTGTGEPLAVPWSPG